MKTRLGVAADEFRMEIARSRNELRRCLARLKSGGRSVGFVPTMGALHEGHLSLVRAIRARCDLSVVSVFVNPTQFGPGEDFERYPRDPDRDCRLLADEKVDVAYLPSVSDMYGSGVSVTVDPGPVGNTFEGRIRPGHFRGVLTVVAILFNQVQPQMAAFGSKDVQQLFLIKRMVSELGFPVEIIESPTVRESDGLAMSSRNAYLSSTDRGKANVLWRSLRTAVTALDQGERSLPRIQHALRSVLDTEPAVIPDYATVVSEDQFVETDPLAERVHVIVAGRLGPVRLIDNMRWSKA